MHNIFDISENEKNMVSGGSFETLLCIGGLWYAFHEMSKKKQLGPLLRLFQNKATIRDVLNPERRNKRLGLIFLKIFGYGLIGGIVGRTIDGMFKK